MSGEVRAEDGAAVSPRRSLRGGAWLTLDRAARLTVKHSRTAREVSITGPARVLPCRRGEELFLVAEGTVGTVAGPGARPGAEVLLASPLGVIRYGDASLEARVTATALAVQVRSGTAWIALAGTDEPERIQAGARWARQAAAPPGAAGLISACRQAAEDASSRAEAVLDPGAGRPGLGDLAAAHLLARQQARWQCAAAAASLGLLPEGDGRRRLREALEEAERRWNRLPSPPKRAK